MSGSLMHEISNDGAQERFAGFLDELIVPVMVKVAQVAFASYRQNMILEAVYNLS